jgi:hypothetical protein
MNATQTTEAGSVSSIQLIGAIAGKDIVDALKNRTILGIMVGVLFMIISVQALPLLMKLDDRPRLAVYDPDRALLGALRRSEAVQAGAMRSTAEVLSAVRTASAPVLGLDLPPGFSELDGPSTIAGYVPHWADATDVVAARAAAEAELTTSVGRPITIVTTTVYPQPGEAGRATMLASGFMLATTMTALIVVPFLFLEEREANTLVLLSLSPASSAHIVIGKALAGMTYSLAAGLVLLAFNISFVVHWPLFLGALLAGALFSVMLGLLVGISAKSHNSVNVWAMLLMLALVVPAMVVSFSMQLPDWLGAVLPWLPTVATMDLLGLATAGSFGPAQVVRPLTVLLGATVGLFALVVWRSGRVAA